MTISAMHTTLRALIAASETALAEQRAALAACVEAAGWHRDAYRDVLAAEQALERAEAYARLAARAALGDAKLLAAERDERVRLALLEDPAVEAARVRLAEARVRREETGHALALAEKRASAARAEVALHTAVIGAAAGPSLAA